jgi:sodium transport system permease protein
MSRSTQQLGAGQVAWRVFVKELMDALRDRKTLVAVILSSCMGVPLMLFVLSTVVQGIEERAEKREIYLVGATNAPEIVNFLQRQSYTIKEPPADFEAQLQSAKFGHAVVRIPADFAKQIEAGESPKIEVLSDSSNRNAVSSAGTVRGLIAGHAREHGRIAQAMRGGSGGVALYTVEDIDLASTASRGAQLMGMLPFFVLMAVLYGAMNASLDTTAGERERASLEPLLSTPASRVGLVLGKWSAVAALAMSIAAISVLSFYPSRLLLKNESLSAMFQFGLAEGLAFLVALIPFAASLSAGLMAVAIRGKTFKEAQAMATFVILGVNLTPLVSIVSTTGEQPWYLWVPGLAQQTVMLRVLKGEALTMSHLLVPTLTSAALAGVCLWLVVNTLKSAAVKA